jgi:hypothetical protein
LLQSLIHQPGFEGVWDLVLGRFQRASEMNPDTLKAIVESKRGLSPAFRSSPTRASATPRRNLPSL